MRQGDALRRRLGALALLPLALTACSSSTDAGDKYTQTWPKNYGDTTCSEWSSKMTEKQRWVAAADILTSARKVDGATGLPSDSLISTFQGGITTACVVGTMAIAEVGAGVYLTEGDRFTP